MIAAESAAAEVMAEVFIAEEMAGIIFWLLEGAIAGLLERSVGSLDDEKQK